MRAADSPCVPSGLRFPSADDAVDPRRTGDIRRQVRIVLASIKTPRVRYERRREPRYPYPYPLYITPVDHDGGILCREIFVYGKQLSELGLDFYHQDPLPYRRVMVRLAAGQSESVRLLLDLSWCRFNRHGWYDSGGRFIRVAASPDRLEVAAAPDESGGANECTYIAR